MKTLRALFASTLVALCATAHAQVSDASPVEGFGTALPEGLQAKDVVALVAPGRDASLATLVGVRRWPGHTGAWVAIVCIAPNPETFARLMSRSGNQPVCRTDEPSLLQFVPEDAYLAVLDGLAPGQSPRVVASYGKPLDVETNWHQDDMDPDEWRRADGGLAPHGYKRLDFAPYRIAPTQTAFGLRTAYEESYGGGGGEFEGLALFVQDGDRLRNVLAEPVAYSMTMAGEYDEDGNRQGATTEDQYTLSVLPRMSNGHYKLRMKSLNAHWSMDFEWNATAQRYLPVAANGSR